MKRLLLIAALFASPVHASGIDYKQGFAGVALLAAGINKNNDDLSHAGVGAMTGFAVDQLVGADKFLPISFGLENPKAERWALRCSGGMVVGMLGEGAQAAFKSGTGDWKDIWKTALGACAYWEVEW